MDPGAVTTVAIQHALDHLGDDDRPRVTAHRRHLEALLCAAALQEAIRRAEFWYAERENELRLFDRRAAQTVWQLVVEARVRPSLAWAP
jgi:hypothetical protein